MYDMQRVSVGNKCIYACTTSEIRQIYKLAAECHDSFTELLARNDSALEWLNMTESGKQLNN